MAQIVSRYLPQRNVNLTELAYSYGAKLVVPSGRDIWAQFPSEELAREYFHHIRDNGFRSAGAFKGNYSHTWDVRVR